MAKEFCVGMGQNSGKVEVNVTVEEPVCCEPSNEPWKVVISAGDSEYEVGKWPVENLGFAVDDDAVLTIRLLGDAKGDGRAVVRRELMLPASKVRMRALDQN